MSIPTLHMALDILGSVLVREFMETPLDSTDDGKYLTPNEIVLHFPMRRILDRIAGIVAVDLDAPMPELSGRIPNKVCQKDHGDVTVFEALLERLSKRLVTSWCDQSIHAFNGRTPNEMLEYEGGELKIIEHIELLAAEHDIITEYADSSKPSVA